MYRCAWLCHYIVIGYLRVLQGHVWISGERSARTSRTGKGSARDSYQRGLDSHQRGLAYMTVSVFERNYCRLSTDLVPWAIWVRSGIEFEWYEYMSNHSKMMKKGKVPMLVLRLDNVRHKRQGYRFELLGISPTLCFECPMRCRSRGGHHLQMPTWKQTMMILHCYEHRYLRNIFCSLSGLL